MSKFKSWCISNDVEINGKTIFIFIFILILLFKPDIIFGFIKGLWQGLTDAGQTQMEDGNYEPPTPI